MRSSTVAAIALGLAVGLAGCAATPSSYHAQVKPTEYRLDHQKMNDVDARARIRGVRVVWVNLPVKPIDAVDE